MNLLVTALVVVFIWLVRKFVWDGEEGTSEQRERNPELNTKNYEMHERRLVNFSKSKYKNECFISRLMVVVTTIRQLEGKFFADG